MSSGDHFKEATRRAAAGMTVEERILRSLELGRSDLEFYAAVSGQTLEQASRAVRARRFEERKEAQQGGGR